MRNHDTIIRAIQNRNLIQFYYDGGVRVIEPHLLARTEKDNYAINGWQVRGYSSSGRLGWRTFVLDEIGVITALEETFTGTRPDYDPTGGRNFHGVIAHL